MQLVTCTRSLQPSLVMYGLWTVLGVWAPDFPSDFSHALFCHAWMVDCTGCKIH